MTLSWKSEAALMALLVAGAPGARAAFRGDEDAPRDYRLNRDYFQNVAKIRAPRDEERDFDWKESGYRGVAGSLNSSDMYLGQWLKAPVREDYDDGSPAFVGALEYEEDQDFHGAYRQFLLRGGPALGDDWSAQVVAVLDGRKEYADAGLSLRQETGERRFETRLTLPNAVFPGKNPAKDTYDQRPVNLLLQWRERLDEGLALWLRSESDFRSTIRRPSRDNSAFVFRQFASRAGADLSLRRGWTLFAQAGALDGRKAVTRDSPEGYDLRLSHKTVSAEAVSGPRAPGRWRLGCEFDHLREARTARAAGGRSSRINRDDYLAYAYRTFPCRGRLTFDLGLHLKLGDRYEVALEEPDIIQTDSGLKSQAVFELTYQGRRMDMALSPAWDIDDSKFGGGYFRLGLSF